MSDARETIPVKGNFYSILEKLYRNRETASLLYDENGINRANGRITELNEKSLLLDSGIRINLSGVVAVNGIFASDYTEC
jgi:hypothetical protein